MKSIADVNVFLPLLIGQHPAHSAARTWFDAQTDGAIGWSLTVELGVLRLLCNRTVMGDDVLAPVAALDIWAALAADPRMVEVGRIPAHHDAALRAWVVNREPSPNLWADAWLAALAQCLNCELVTFDQGFRAFDGLTLRLLDWP